MNFKRFIQDYFTFSRNERKGITVLLILIFMMGIANKVIFYFERPARIDVNLLDSASHKLGLNSDSLNQKSSNKKLFSFNPNTIDSVGLDSLDLPVIVKLNLLKFRNKNGRIYSSSDFKKIYGVTEDIYLKIEPYLIFDSKENTQEAIFKKLELFQFDPNLTSDRDFQRLGLSERQISTIRNYLAKGGYYRTKDDFLKMWGLSDHQKDVLADYVVIENRKIITPEKQISNTVDLIELNASDSIALKQLPGIGDKLSKRIIKYRDLLGGFYSLAQLQEVYGLTIETFQKIESRVSIDTTKIRKLDLNFDGMKEFSKHPYIQKNLAEKIVKFRTSHGKIKDLSILREKMILNMDDYNRLRPYF